jgi:hypothetical protein
VSLKDITLRLLNRPFLSKDSAGSTELEELTTMSSPFTQNSLLGAIGKPVSRLKSGRVAFVLVAQSLTHDVPNSQMMQARLTSVSMYAYDDAIGGVADIENNQILLGFAINIVAFLVVNMTLKMFESFGQSLAPTVRCRLACKLIAKAIVSLIRITFFFAADHLENRIRVSRRNTKRPTGSDDQIVFGDFWVR